MSAQKYRKAGIVSPVSKEHAMRATACWTIGLVALILANASNLIGEQEKMKQEPTKMQGVKRLLVVTHTAGFRHTDSIEMGEKILAELAQQSGHFTVSYCRTADEVQKMLTPEYLNENQFDGVIFLNTTGDIGIPDLKAFLEWLKGGKAFIGIHAATDTYHNRPEYIEMIGGEFAYHGQQTKVRARVEDRKHPAVAHLGAEWEIFDEIYLFKENTRDKVKVLLSLDQHPDDGTPNAGKPGDYLLAWCRDYGKGRVFYTALGHRIDVWQNPAYQKHLLGGIEWALRLR